MIVKSKQKNELHLFLTENRATPQWGSLPILLLLPLQHCALIYGLRVCAFSPTEIGQILPNTMGRECIQTWMSFICAIKRNAHVDQMVRVSTYKICRDEICLRQVCTGRGWGGGGGAAGSFKGRSARFDNSTLMLKINSVEWPLHVAAAAFPVKCRLVSSLIW